MWSTRTLHKFFQLSWADKGLLLEASWWLLLARLTLLLIPFRRIAPRLGILQHQSASTVPAPTAQTAARIGWAIATVARRTPWESSCFTQAIGGKAMLRRRHIQSTLYLGVAKDKTKSLQAHAWLRCGEAILTGQAGHEQYTVLSTFAEKTPTVTTLVDLDALLLEVLNPVPQTSAAEKLHQLSETEWEGLIQAAKRQHVLTLFFAHLQKLTGETAVPPHLWLNMQQEYQQVTLQNLAIYRELHLINQKMQAANIPLIVLKGPYLATAVYPHIGQRAIGDLDLLVAPDAVLPTAKLLRESGWQETKSFTLDSLRKYRHHLPEFTKPDVNFPIEIHWNIVRPLEHNTISPTELWAQSQQASLNHEAVRTFQPHLQLLHLALHAAYNHQFAFDLRSLCDIALLIQSTQIDWQKFITQTTAWQVQRGIYLTLKLVEDFWQIGFPPELLAELKQIPENLIETAKRQLLWGRSNNFGITANFSQLKSNRSLWGKTKFTLHFVFPTQDFLSSRYGVKPHSRKIWLYYLINLRDLLKRNIKRTWQLLRGQDRITLAVHRRNQLSEWLAKTE